MITDPVTNFWGFIGASFAALAGVVIAVINTRSKASKKETEKVKDLSDKIDALESEFKSLKDSFTLVCDEMERNETMTPQLKHFRKLFQL